MSMAFSMVALLGEVAAVLAVLAVMEQQILVVMVVLVFTICRLTHPGPGALPRCGGRIARRPSRMRC